MTTAQKPPVDKSAARVQRMFGQIAPRYDFLNRLLSMGVDRYWRWQTVRRVPPQRSDAPLLDLCSGTGDLALAYAKRLPTEARVVGADFCHEMLAIGRAKAANAGYNSRLAFVEADALRLPFEDDRFQIVCVAFGLRNLSDTDAGLREMTRVASPCGRVAVLEFSMPQRQPVRGLYRWYFRHVLPRVGQALARNDSAAYNYLPASVGEFPQGEALCERMRAAGLRDVEHTPLTFGIATLYVGVKP